MWRGLGGRASFFPIILSKRDVVVSSRLNIQSRAAIGLACATLLNGGVLTVAMAQEGGEMAPRPERVCPATGYAEPDYTYAGRNVDGPAPAETASPCIPQIVFDVGDAIGMTRSTGGMLSIKNVIALRFIASGEFGVSGTKMEKVEGVEFQGSYYLPASRLMIPRTDGKSDIRWPGTKPQKVSVRHRRPKEASASD